MRRSSRTWRRNWSTVVPHSSSTLSKFAPVACTDGCKMLVDLRFRRIRGRVTIDLLEDEPAINQRLEGRGDRVGRRPRRHEREPSRHRTSDCMMIAPSTTARMRSMISARAETGAATSVANEQHMQLEPRHLVAVSPSFLLLVGPHPHSLSLGGFAPRSGRRRFFQNAWPMLKWKARRGSSVPPISRRSSLKPTSKRMGPIGDR